MLKNSDGVATDPSADASFTTTESLSFTVGSSTLALGNATPLGTVTGSTSLTVNTNAGGGYVLSIKRDGAAATLTHADAVTGIVDKGAWDPAASSGAGNAAAFSGTGLGFRLNQGSTLTDIFSSTWWGTDGSPKYAGTSSSYVTVGSTSNFESGAKGAVVDWRLSVPATQKSGAYSGSVTYRVSTNI